MKVDFQIQYLHVSFLYNTLSCTGDRHCEGVSIPAEVLCRVGLHELHLRKTGKTSFFIIDYLVEFSCCLPSVERVKPVGDQPC